MASYKRKKKFNPEILFGSGTFGRSIWSQQTKKKHWWPCNDKMKWETLKWLID